MYLVSVSNVTDPKAARGSEPESVPSDVGHDILLDLTGGELSRSWQGWNTYTRSAIRDIPRLMSAIYGVEETGDTA